MGQAKALLRFGDEPLIVRLVEQLLLLFEEVVVVAAPGQALPSVPAKVVHDEVPYQGPVGGIYYGLHAASGNVGFVTSCDSAFLSRPLIEHLLTPSVNDVVVPRFGGRLQPLFARYSKTVLPHLEAQLASGDRKLVHLFEKVRTRVVEEDEIRMYDPDGASFFNMNTPADYAEALTRWRRA